MVKEINMPTEADKLTKDSSDTTVKQSISACISQMHDEHPDWDNDRVVAACHQMARKATGRNLGGRTPGGAHVKETRKLE